MTLVLLAFAAGVLLLQVQAELPSAGWVWVSPFLFLGLVPKARAKPLFALGLGFCWALGFAHLRMADRLAPEFEGTDIAVVGVVSGLPAQSERGPRFEFEPESADARLPRKILLSWYRSPSYQDSPAIASLPVHPGERWRFTVRLRRPHGSFNPNGFDYEA